MFWVPLLLLASAVTGLACGRLCLTASRAADQEAGAPSGYELTLYEAAFLAGGPARVADVTLVAMARTRRLLIAHTGWATVVDPVGRDAMERSVLGAIGPAGQARIAPIRRGAATADAVRALADRLVGAGLAVPDGVASGVAAAVRQVRAATVVVLALGAAAVLMPGQTRGGAGQVPVAVWFGLPLLLCVGCLVIARVEVHPYPRWASPAGRRLLGALSTRDDHLTAVAVRGVGAVADPGLRAALSTRRGPGAAHGGH
ncbi:TIGR04222 domain-containing membrane protein [Streptomyces sp. KN37]|uniref:TIGR04222 domain-containing membrane protein n=1 Tax=Streptomyces sp. KN37 TaxID=3090667 RepID=UPI002A74D065|nr:TIGR04222 domain-containing membrane protein [Streptomyces sp. KN37]WPO70676.1 TIGR04222 domain-containing membrane protein [Streptomyces sp. KN37]